MSKLDAIRQKAFDYIRDNPSAKVLLINPNNQVERRVVHSRVIDTKQKQLPSK